MSMKLDRFPVAGGSPRYPWSEWLNGDVLQLRAGEDFTCQATTLVQSARSQAEKRGGTVRTRHLRDDDGESVVIQFRAVAQ